MLCSWPRIFKSEVYAHRVRTQVFEWMLNYIALHWILCVYFALLCPSHFFLHFLHFHVTIHEYCTFKCSPISPEYKALVTQHNMLKDTFTFNLQLIKCPTFFWIVIFSNGMVADATTLLKQKHELLLRTNNLWKCYCSCIFANNILITNKVI